MIRVLLKRLSKRAQHPVQSCPGDAGQDLVCVEGGIVWPFSTRDFSTGWRIKVSAGYWGSIKARSSTLMKRRLLINEGVIDSGYTGELSILVFNPTWWPKRVKAGDRLAQIILMPHVPEVDMLEVETLPETHRGQNGFGSTGMGV